MPPHIQTCPCGTVDSPLCTAIDHTLETPENALDALCSADGFGECYVTKHDAYCICRCGYAGDFCEDEVTPLNYNFALATVVPFGILLVSLFWLYRSPSASLKKQTHLTKSQLVTSEYKRITPKILFLIRAYIAATGYFILIFGGILYSGKTFNTFTVWNWILLTFFFSIGSYLSFTYLNLTDEERKGYLTSYDLNAIETIFYVFLQVELPAGFLVSIVFWGILFPATTLIGQSAEYVTVTTIFQHAINLCFLLLEFAIDKVYINLSHAAFLPLWAGLYAIFHGFFLLVLDALNKSHCPVYAFLALDTNFFVLWMLLLILCFFLFYFVVYFFSHLKRRFFDEFYHKNYPANKEDIEKEAEAADETDNPGNSSVQSGATKLAVT